MTTGNPFKIRTMEKGDLPEAFALAHSEGWNQTESDWKFLLNNPHNKCIAALVDNKLAGTATALVYSDRLAWIGMVLVSRSYRSLGIGRQLMTEIIKRLENTECIKLDATPAGQPLYESLGFRSEYSLVRMTAEKIVRIKPDLNVSGVSQLTEQSLEKVIEADAPIFGTSRAGLLSYLYNNSPDRSLILSEGSSVSGYFLGRHGTRLNYLGPLCANTGENAELLLAAALSKLEGSSAAVDVFADRTGFIPLLENSGFIKQREFTRMYLNKNTIQGSTEYQYLISGPEFG